MKQPTAVFLLKIIPGMRVEDGQVFYSPLSHNNNLAVMAQEAVRLGWQVYIKPVDGERCYEIEAVYPVLKIRSAREFMAADFDVDVIVSVAVPDDIVMHRKFKPNAKGVFIMASHYWMEESKGLTPIYTDMFRLMLSHDADFIIAQNPRMKDIAEKFYFTIAGWKWPERILCAPLTFTPEQLQEAEGAHDRAQVRAQMGLSDNDIAIINSGGTWDMTDTEAFLTGFMKAVKDGATRLRFYQMGVRQKGNLDHERTVRFVRKFIVDHFDYQGKALMMIDDWEEASRLLPAYNYGADLGLNVSHDTAENYQSHRVRFVDYLKAGLPVLNSSGTYFADYTAAGAVLTVKPGDVDGYYNLCMQLHRGEIDLGRLRRNMEQLRQDMTSNHIFPPVLKQIAETEALPLAERQQMVEMLAETYKYFASFPTGLFRPGGDGVAA